MRLMTILKNEIKSIIILYFAFFTITSLQAQCQLDDNVKKIIAETGLKYQQPDNYFCITPPSSYFSIHPGYNQSSSLVSVINNDSRIMITFSLIPYPKPTTKTLRYLIATVDMNHISKKAIAAQIDTTLSKMIYIDTLQLKKINADRGVIYNIKVKNLYLGTYARCKKIEIYKDNVGRTEMLFFYNRGQENIVEGEIKKTWGMLKFEL